MQKQLTAQLTTYQGENIALLKEFGSKSAEETMRETIAPMLAACGFDEFGVSAGTIAIIWFAFSSRHAALHVTRSWRVLCSLSS